MKTHYCKLGLVVALSLFSMATFAKEPTKHHAEEESSDTGGGIALNVKIGAGFSTFGMGALGAGSPGAMDIWVELNSHNSLQFLVGIATTNPFAFGYGTIYRHTCLGDEEHLGAHLGLGFNLGTVANLGVGGGSTFFMNAFPIMGFHFNLGGALSNIRLSFDGGPIFALTPAFQFSLQPMSGLVGGTINYFF